MNYAGRLKITIKTVSMFTIIFILTMVIPAWSQLNDKAPWPGLHKDIRHTARTSVIGPQNPSIQWKFHVGAKGEGYWGPSIDEDGTLYIGSKENTGLYAVNSDGTLKWHYNMGNNSNYYPPGTPAISSDGTIYVGKWQPGNLFAFQRDGTVKWTYTPPTGSGYWMGGSPAIDTDGTIYIPDYNNYPRGALSAVNPDGTVKWYYPISWSGDERDPVSTVAIDDNLGQLYFGASRKELTYGDFNLLALDRNGNLLWTFLTMGPVYGSPAIGSDGTVYFGSRNGEFYAVDPNGNLKWSYPTGRIHGCPAIASDGTIFIGSLDTYLYAFNPDGTVRWKFQTGDYIGDMLAVDGNDTVYAGNADKNLYAVDINGNLKWSIQLGDAVSGNPAIGADGTIYLLANDGYLYAIGDSTSSNPAISATPVSHDFGALVVGNSSSVDITISNNGSGDLLISAMTISDTTNFSIDQNGGSSPCGSLSPTITAGVSCTVSAFFQPSTGGSFDTVLSIDSNDPNISTLDITLMGVGATQQHTLSVTKSGNGSGTVTSSPAGINCGSDCSETYSNSTVVTLTATPDIGSVSGGLTGGSCSGADMCTLTVNGSVTITALFTSAGSFTITATAGSGGTVTPTSQSVNHGSSADVSITPDSGYLIKDVLVDGVSVGAVSAYTFTNVTSNHTLNAIFEPLSSGGSVVLDIEKVDVHLTNGNVIMKGTLTNVSACQSNTTKLDILAVLSIEDSSGSLVDVGLTINTGWVKCKNDKISIYGEIDPTAFTFANDPNANVTVTVVSSSETGAYSFQFESKKHKLKYRQ